MKHKVNLAILGVIFVCGLSPCVESSTVSARGQTSGQDNRESDLTETRAAVFKVPDLWEYSAPLISPEKRDTNPSRAQKDPTVVFYDGKWHVFMTVKLPGRSAIEYCAFAQWKDADRSTGMIRL